MKNLFLLITIFSLGSVFAQNTSNLSNNENQSEEFITAFPTGAIATFSKPIPDSFRGKSPIVYLKSELSGKIWIAEPQVISSFSSRQEKENSGNPESSSVDILLLGFVIPQIERGVYVAWYENAENSSIEDSFKLEIEPKLLAREALLVDNPAEKVKIQVGINSTYKLEKGNLQPTKIKLPIKLTIFNQETADFAEGQNAESITDEDGYATWVINIKKEGVAKFVAESDGYDSVEIIIVGKPKEPKQLEIAEERFEKSKEITAQKEDQAFIVQESVSAQRLRVVVGETQSEKRILSEKVELAKSAERNFEIALQKEIEAREQFENIERNFRLTFSTLNLLPGDVLLMKGTTPLISEAIRTFDGKQLGIPARYSHTSLYVGLVGNKPMVVEMLKGGYTLNTLKESIAGATLVDVFRWIDINNDKRNQIAQKGLNICGNPSIKRSCIPYAFEQIKVMGKAAILPSLLFNLQNAVDKADSTDGGRQKMICSELVAWIYEDLGLNPQAEKWWNVLESNGVLNSQNRRKDYTTPNMLAISGKFQRIGRLKGIGF